MISTSLSSLTHSLYKKIHVKTLRIEIVKLKIVEALILKKCADQKWNIGFDRNCNHSECDKVTTGIANAEKITTN